jgi:cytoskeleton protein RodZ
MPALGEEFRGAREARGLTLSDVAERLHIRSVYLAAIEEEDWATIGAPVYVRGFLRTYARYLGIDPESAVARFAATASEAATVRPAAVVHEERPGAERRGLSPAAIVAIAIAVIAIGFVGYEFYLYQAGSGRSVPVANASAAPATAPAAAEATPAAAASPEAVVRAAPLPSAPPLRQLAVRVTDTSWLRVVIDGKLALQGTFPPGTSKTFTGNTADVRVGNAGGVQIAVDGRAVGTLGGSGDVAERRFRLTGE